MHYHSGPAVIDPEAVVCFIAKVFKQNLDIKGKKNKDYWNGLFKRITGQEGAMDAIVLMIVAFAGYILAYNTYGKFIGRKIFNLSEQAVVPSREFEDGRDFVPTKKWIIFGHHYTSIAGTGPIVGPAIGIIWGWVPAMLWILFGSILIGAVHDFGSLVVSLRNQGKSISDITSKYIGPRIRYVFFLIVFLELLIVIAIFGLVIAVIFSMFPGSVLPVWAQIPIAITLGYIIYKRSGNVMFSTCIAVAVMYGTVLLGNFLPFNMPSVAGIPATGVWSIILLMYAFFASCLPVTTLLQPRDYMNAWQLFIAMGLLVLGILSSGLFSDLTLVAPAVNLNPEGAPSIIPFLFITIACGAVSGFHSLVSSGTSSKQVATEHDARFVGYGSMLMEAALATLVIIAVGAGIGLLANKAGMSGTEAWQQHYASWTAAKGLGAKVSAFVNGAANMLTCIGIPVIIGKVIMGVFVASFAGTTLDTATRVQRYVVTELFSDLKIGFMTNKYSATGFAVITALVLAFATGADGKGALTLWPLFGAVNQLLAALALLVVTIYLQKKGGYKYLISGIPCAFMLVLTLWSVILNEITFCRQANWLLAVINGATLVLSVFIVIESARTFMQQSPEADGAGQEE